MSYSSAADHAGLLRLLLPVHRAAEQSPWLKSLVDAGKAFQPQAWTPGEAYQFLRNVPVFEACGLVVRIPDWWKPRHRSCRPWWSIVTPGCGNLPVESWGWEIGRCF